MENILYLANTPVTNSVRRYQPISYLVHDGAQGGIVVSPDLLFLNYYGNSHKSRRRYGLVFQITKYNK